MAFELNIPLNDSDNITFDSDKVQVVATGTKLKLINNSGQNFVEDFASDSGFIYDSAKAEFVGGQVQQKDQQPVASRSWVTYENGIDLNFGGGVKTGTAVGGAVVVGSKLDLKGGTLKYVNYDAVLNADSQQSGAIKLKYTPNYSGTPSARSIFGISKAYNDPANRLQLSHILGQLQIVITDSVNTSIVIANLGAWSPTAGVTYEIELNWNIQPGFGVTKLYVDGTQFGATQTGTGVRDANIDWFSVGTDYGGTINPDCEIEDFIVFSSPRHTSNYTPGYTLEEAKYLASSVVLPEMVYTGVGTLISFDAFLTTQGVTPKYTLQIARSGNYLYWDGAAWITSDNTYSQANSFATFAANVATLPVEGQIYGQFKILFDNSDNQSYVSSLTASLTAQIYPVDNPKVDINTPLYNEGILSFITTLIVTGTDDIRWILSKGNTYYYWNGTAWVYSNGTYNQSTTSADVTANISTFNSTEENILTSISFFLHSNDGSTTPENQKLFLLYNFFGGEVDTPNQCEVFGYIFDDDSLPVEGVTITITTLRTTGVYDGESVVCLGTKTTITDIDGYWDINLTETDNMPSVIYLFQFDCNGSTEKYKRKVPDEVSKNFSDLTEF